MRRIIRFPFYKRCVYPIGVDMGDDVLKVARLCRDNGRVRLIGCAGEQIPDQMEFDSSIRQRWVADTLKRLTANGAFKTRKVITALPANNVFIDRIKLPKAQTRQLAAEVSSQICEKLGFETNDTFVKYVISGGEAQDSKELDVLVMAIQKIKLERHLAIYENTDLEVQAGSVWPFAMASSYTGFFARRTNDKVTVVMLVQTTPDSANVAICRYNNLLFARSVPITGRQLTSKDTQRQLVMELEACARYFESIQPLAKVERLIFFAGRGISSDISDTITAAARRLHIPAQIGDVLTAVDTGRDKHMFVERRDSTVNWATAFGLSLS